MFLSPQDSYIEILNPQNDGMRRRGFGEVLNHEGGTLMNGISTLLEETLESSLAPLLLCKAYS